MMYQYHYQELATNQHWFYVGYLIHQLPVTRHSFTVIWCSNKICGSETPLLFPNSQFPHKCETINTLWYGQSECK